MSFSQLFFFIFPITAGIVSAEILWKDVCTQNDTKDLPFCDMKLSRKERVADFVDRVDLKSKSKMMINDANSFHKLHIPYYEWWSEGLHGPLEPCVCDYDNVTCKCPTSFPCPSALASSFNNTLYNLIGSADGIEGRAINNMKIHNRASMRAGNVGDGITYWSPTINMQRDPRWGRNQEVPGEDPVLTGQYAVNFVRGLQEGEDPNHLQVGACCKHFIANSVEDWHGHSRHNFDAKVSKGDLANYYLPAFRACVMEGKSVGVMCSYNSVNGIPACSNQWLLNTTLRGTWDFQGYVTSDCGAIFDIFHGHNYTVDGSNATALSIQAGTDVDCGNVYENYIPKAIEMGLLSEEQLKLSFSRLVDIQMRLGLFDSNKKDQPYFNYGLNDIDTAAHQKLALEAAHQSIVLLKNEDGILPLQAGRKIAVIGPHFNTSKVFLSNYHGWRCPGFGHKSELDFACMETVLSSVEVANVNGTTVGTLGCDVKSMDNSKIYEAVELASSVDDIVLMVGNDLSIENEGRDRINTTLPGVQVELINQILSLSKPTVLVLVSGGTISLGNLKDSVPAIVSATYGGERAAKAISDVLFGVYNPSGKLAATIYPPEYVNQIPLTDMSLQTPPGRTHMFYLGEAEFSFGHGLSYTLWGLSWPESQFPQPLRLQTNKLEGMEIDTIGKILKLDVKVCNLGQRAGKQTVLLFMIPHDTKNMIGKNNTGLIPLQQKLLGYESVDSVSPGEKRIIRFYIDSLNMAVADGEGNMVIMAGTYDFVFRDGKNELRRLVVVDGPPMIVTPFPGQGDESMFAF